MNLPGSFLFLGNSEISSYNFLPFRISAVIVASLPRTVISVARRGCKKLYNYREF